MNSKETRYATEMALARQLLEANLITKSEYEKIKRHLQKVYRIEIFSVA